MSIFSAAPILDVSETEPTTEDRSSEFVPEINRVAKIVTIHQPNYIPWIGLFSKVSSADCLIIYDKAQYEKNSVINRNKIRTDKGFAYLTVPVGKYHTETKISEITLPQENDWKREHWRKIKANYAKAPFFKDYAGFFEVLFQRDFRYLSELNERILLYLLSCFEISVDVVRTSQLTVDPSLSKTDLMLAYLKKVGAGVYISGPSGRNYLETEGFPQNNIALKFFKFQHPVYPQRYPGFQPNMSALDLLFNVGPSSGAIVKRSASVEDYPSVMRGEK
ncbi:MAG: WbqC family protein [Dehalococcoidales bacterium]|nr:WbqC family protein [Dehalococcoidales bacterium]